jgi:hypothetical protein
VRFLLDAMLPPATADRLNAAGHDAATPTRFGPHNLPDAVLVRIAAAEERVLVTENASDFAHVTSCAILFVRKSWWPAEGLASSLAGALGRWAGAHPDPGTWPHWMGADVL